MIPSPERQEEFLATMPNVIVATVRRTGLPQLTPVWYLWTGEEFWISCAASTAKVHNLRRDARIVLCIDDPVSGDYVQIIGTRPAHRGSGRSGARARADPQVSRRGRRGPPLGGRSARWPGR